MMFLKVYVQYITLPREKKLAGKIVKLVNKFEKTMNFVQQIYLLSFVVFMFTLLATISRSGQCQGVSSFFSHKNLVMFNNLFYHISGLAMW